MAKREMVLQASEADIHKALAGLLTKRQQGRVMGLLRHHNLLYDPRAADATGNPGASIQRAHNRIYDLLLDDDGQAHKEARRYLEQADPALYAKLVREVVE